MRYIMMIKPRDGVAPSDVVEQLNRASDWFRLSSTAWIVVSDLDAARWSARLRPLVQDGGNLFICKLDATDRKGWMSRKFWDWMSEHDADDDS